MRTTVDLPEPLLANAKGLAAERSATLSAVIEDALRTLFSFSGKPTAATPVFHLRTVSGRLVDPNIDLDRTSALIVADDEEAF